MTEISRIADAPLSLDQFSAQHKRHVDPRAPRPLRDMGAKGLVPGIGPGDLVKVLYNLSFDQECASTAGETIRELPAEVRRGALGADLPATVLDYCARCWLADAVSVETILRHAGTADETVAFIAGKCDAQLADVVAENQIRFVRYPAIVEQLYTNPAVHQSTVDRVVEFVRRQGVELTGLPGLQAAIKGGMEGQPEVAPASDEAIEAVARDDAFANILQDSVERSEAEEREGVTMEQVQAKVGEFSELLEDAMSEMESGALDGFGDESKRQAAQQEEESGRYVSKQVLIGQMRISEKVRMATIGGKEERMLLLKDSNRLVYMAALLSPKMQPEDLKSLAGNKNMPTEVIAFISNKKDLLRDYSVVKSLANNPKTALRTGIRLLAYLRTSDLRQLSRSRNISPQLVRMAKNQLKKKGK